jgi:murein L,D-transpeptidase YafK
MKKTFWSSLLMTLSLYAQVEKNTTNTPTTTPHTNTVKETDTPTVDLVTVIKSKRKMYLSCKGKILKTYRVALGSNEGDKQKEGDRKTPEGYYTLDYFKENSSFYKALRISYPNPNDILQAKEAGVNPGGQIMLHGQPNGQSWWKTLFKQNRNWTAGCIALHNDEMDEVLTLVKVGTPIVIKP